MGLEIRKGRDGKWRKIWYGAYTVNGKRYAVNLGIKIAGTPPSSMKLKDEGDGLFERSRAKAQAKLDHVIEETRSKANAVHLVEHLYEVKTGDSLKSVGLEDLADEWKKIPRSRNPSERYIQQGKSVLNRFAHHVVVRHRNVDELGQITKSIAREFMKVEGDRGIAPKTWNDSLKLLRTAFDHLLPEGAPNPFVGIPSKQSETVFRQPFTPEELKAIVEEAQKHEFIRPIIITGICTAMRRGDCCMLKWANIDLSNAFITVKTSKTGQTVNIPIFPLLFDELSKRKRKGTYVFPEQATMYQENPDGITWRVKKVLISAFSDDEDNAEGKLLEAPQEEVDKKASAYIESLGPTKKAGRMKQAFEFYQQGLSSAQVCKEVQISKASLSGYLNELEAATGYRIIKKRAMGRSVSAKLRADAIILGSKRDNGQRRASVRDFHSFRVTWVTLALNAGVPLELVQKVTGHKTTEIVLKHYFQPGREDFRNALQSAMPKLLTEGNGRLVAEPPIEYEPDQSPGEELEKALDILGGIKSPKYAKQLKEAIQLVADAKAWFDSTILREDI